MPHFTSEQLAKAMADPTRIRNISIVAQVDAGKSTLSDSILQKVGLISQKDAGDKRQTDTMKQEQERGITIKAVGVTACTPVNGQDHVINLIDSPGHVDFNSEVSAAIRVTDGALVLIDTLDGVKAQTKTVLTQALEERCKPVLVINKVDKLFCSLHMANNEIYDQFVKNVEDVNEIIDTYQDPRMVKITRDQRVDPTRGDVVFAAAYQTWGFSLKTMALFYKAKNKNMADKPVDKLMKMLWKRDNFINMIIKPLYYVLNACATYPQKSIDEKTLPEVLKILGLEVPEKDLQGLAGTKLIRRVMSTWLPVADSVIQLTVDHLPSPKDAQKYRAELLYKGPKDDEYFKSIQACDPNGPLVIYISKMVPTKDNSRFYAFGRIFSGTVRAGKCTIIQPEHDPLGINEEKVTRKKTLISETIQRVNLMMANKVEPVDLITAGSTLGLDGVDKNILKFATISGPEDTKCYPFKGINFSVSPVVQYSIAPKKAQDLGKFVELVRKFVKSDPCLQYIMTKDGEHILAGAGELHLEVSLEQLRTDFLKNIEFQVSEPIVPYCETMISKSDRVCLAKSPNKHNRLYVVGSPLDTDLVSEMEAEDLPKEVKERARHLQEKYGFDDAARKIWKMGPEQKPTNMVLDATKGTQYMNEIKDSVVAGFVNLCDGGPLCDEPLRGVKIDLVDVTLHADSIHRGMGQILPATRRSVSAAMLCGEPRLMEPVFKTNISVPRERMSAIYNLMNKRRGNVGEITEDANGTTVTCEAELPVAESFGFIEDLRGATSGTAFADLVFSHWQLVPGNPLEEGTYANTLMLKIRKRKGMKVEAPNFNDYYDKL